MLKYSVIENSEFFICSNTEDLYRFDKNLKRWKRVNLTPVWKKKHNCFRLQINIDRREFEYARVIYKIHNPNFDLYDKTQMIDHMNGNPLDNKIKNLNIVNFLENSQNRKKRIFWKPDLNRYIFNYTIDGKKKTRRFKNFYIAKLFGNYIIRKYYYHPRSK